MTTKALSAETPLAYLVGRLFAAADHNPADTSPPAAVLWPDRNREWEPLLPLLREQLPQLLTLGPWNVGTRAGPAVWLKCVIGRALSEVTLPTGSVPIVYLPGVSLKDLRAVEDCPRAVQALAELQYRGRVWAQPNGRDWSLFAFLTGEEGLRLDVARDTVTAEAMRRALAKLVHVPVAELTGRTLEAYDFDELLGGGDGVRDVLRWIDDPSVQSAAAAPDRWAAFRTVCKKDFGFDPAHDGRIGAAERMARREKKWAKVWQRYAEAPALYKGVPDALRQARPQGELFGSASESWPQDNEQEEVSLRSQLLALAPLSSAEAATRIGVMEERHSVRRDWVWSQLGLTPIAAALRHLDLLAIAVAKPIAGTTRDEMAVAYAAGGWRADAAVLDALNAVREPPDVAAVRAAIRALYLPWLKQSAERLQSLAAKSPLPGRGAQPNIEATAGTALLFVDGLRLDVAERLREMMTARGWSVNGGWRWSALPSVTPTAKPAVSPVAEFLTGDYMAQEFCPNVGSTAKPLATAVFRQLLDTNGAPYLKSDVTGSPAGGAWTEVGDLDSYGHEQQWRLAWRVPEVLAEIVGRVAQLFGAGWSRVHIVTDHGWLLVPGGLPKTELPGFLAEARWARCAALKKGAMPNVPTVPWHWNPEIPVAIAPGVSAFVANAEYAHGGLSLQECVTATFEVTSGAGALRSVSIASVNWFGLRCRVKLEGDVESCVLDLRTFAADANTTLVDRTKHIDGPGDISLIIPDESKQGCSAQLVIVDETGAVIAKRPTTVGDQ